MLGSAPHRKDKPFNKAEYDALKTEMMLEFLDPGRPKSLTGGLLTAKTVEDVRALEHLATHTEMQVRSARSSCLQRRNLSRSTQQQVPDKMRCRRVAARFAARVGSVNAPGQPH